jgi:hypothetical protein
MVWNYKTIAMSTIHSWKEKISSNELNSNIQKLQKEVILEKFNIYFHTSDKLFLLKHLQLKMPISDYLMVVMTTHNIKVQMSDG